MDQNYKNIRILVIAAVAVLAFVAHASAEWGMGYGHHGWMHQGMGRHYGGYGGPGYGAFGNLSEDEIKKMDEERTAFFDATKDFRQEIYQKRLELSSELAKKNPDAAKAAALQKDISGVKAQLEQKRLDHIIRLRKINPDFSRGFLGGGPMGSGRMHYGMMEPRGYSHRGRPDCPYGGPGGGYGMGPGMMMGPGGGYGRGLGMMSPGYGKDSGMMHRGRGGGMMGSGGSGRADSRQYYGVQNSLADKDAGTFVANYIRSTRNPNLEPGQIKDVGDAFEVEIVTKDKSLVDKVLVDKRSGSIRSVY